MTPSTTRAAWAPPPAPCAKPTTRPARARSRRCARRSPRSRLASRSAAACGSSPRRRDPRDAGCRSRALSETHVLRAPVSAYIRRPSGARASVARSMLRSFSSLWPMTRMRRFRAALPAWRGARVACAASHPPRVSCSRWRRRSSSSGVIALFTPLPSELREPAVPSLRVVSRSGRLLRDVRTDDGARARPRPLSAFPPHVRSAVLAAEDRHFYSHVGVDLTAVCRAAASNLWHRRIVSGASTITMQLARTLRPHKRGLWGKVTEAALALRIESSLSKDQILEEYLNRVTYGPNLRGYAAASQAYFDTTPESLSVAQGALIAGLPRGPSLYAVTKRPELAKRRRDRVLARMADAGMIDEGARDRALAEPRRHRARQAGVRRAAPRARARHRAARRRAARARRGARRSQRALRASHHDRLRAPAHRRGRRDDRARFARGQARHRRLGRRARQRDRRRPRVGRLARFLRRRGARSERRRARAPPARLVAQAVRLRGGDDAPRLDRRDAPARCRAPHPAPRRRRLRPARLRHEAPRSRPPARGARQLAQRARRLRDSRARDAGRARSPARVRLRVAHRGRGALRPRARARRRRGAAPRARERVRDARARRNARARCAS